MRKLLMISYDAVGDHLFNQLMAFPNFSALATRATVTREVDSVFVTNTYPVHASVVTGLPPGAHGLISNTSPFPQPHAPWCYRASLIKTKTLWQAAHQKGLPVAAVLWPVTGGAKEIKYNLPELMTQPGESQLLLNLKYGSKLLQLGLFLKHRHLLEGIRQPALDAFTTACMRDILQQKQPALALVHFTAFDSLCHEYGCGHPKLEEAFTALDHNLGQLLSAAGPDYDVMVFSDHAQLPAENQLLPNQLLVNLGLLKQDEAGGYQPGSCFFECCGGSTFLHGPQLTAQQVESVRQAVASLEGFGRFLRQEEMAGCGRPQLPFGFGLKPGWACYPCPSEEKANHGYPVDTPGYQVFYLLAQEGQAAGQQQGGSLLDLAPMAAKLLGLEMDFSLWPPKNPPEG